MTVPQRILFHVAAGVALVTAIATSVTYTMVQDSTRQRLLGHLDIYVAERARREEIGFRHVHANLVLVRGQFSKRMEAPIPSDYQKKWNDRFRLFPDGAWRSREEFSDGRKWSTLWAHKDAILTPEWQTQILRAQDICNELLPGWAEAFPSVYFVLHGPANIGFDPRIPNWVWDTPGDYKVDGLEWYELAMPKTKPPDGLAWTGVIEEPSTKTPVVSVYLPIELNGRFVGSVGHDLFVQQLMDGNDPQRPAGGDACHFPARRSIDRPSHKTLGDPRDEGTTAHGQQRRASARATLRGRAEPARAPLLRL